MLWIYPRGKAVTAEKDPDLIAGAAGVALCLGADFVKVNPPKPEGDDKRTAAEALKVASMAAGRTGLVCAGGSTVDAETFLTQLLRPDPRGRRRRQRHRPQHPPALAWTRLSA